MAGWEEVYWELVRREITWEGSDNNEWGEKIWGVEKWIKGTMDYFWRES